MTDTLVFFLRNGIYNSIESFLDLTLPQIMLMQHHYYKQKVAELKATIPRKPQAQNVAQHQFDKFIGSRGK